MNSEALDEIWERAEAALDNDGYATALDLYQRLEDSELTQSLIGLGEMRREGWGGGGRWPAGPGLFPPSYRRWQCGRFQSHGRALSLRRPRPETWSRRKPMSNGPSGIFPRGCLQLVCEADFASESGRCKAKIRANVAHWRVFLTQQMSFYGVKAAATPIANSP